MFEKYTEKARRVIFFSRYEASLIGGRAIEPEHILLLRSRELKLEELVSRISAGSITPQSKKGEAPIVRFLTQLNALVEVLVRQGVFTREEFVEELAGLYILPDLHATLQSLLGLLSRKGVIKRKRHAEDYGFDAVTLWV